MKGVAVEKATTGAEAQNSEIRNAALKGRSSTSYRHVVHART